LASSSRDNLISIFFSLKFSYFFQIILLVA